MELVGWLFHGLQGKKKTNKTLASVTTILVLWDFRFVTVAVEIAAQIHGINVNVHKAAWLGHWATAPQRSCSLA